MRKVLLFPFLLLALFAAAQDPVVKNIPADKVAEASKPFVGTFDGVACESTPVGLRLQIAQTGTNNPVATIVQEYDGTTVEEVGSEWLTIIFTTRVIENEPHNFLYSTNQQMVISLTPINNRLIGMTAPQQTNLLFRLQTKDQILSDAYKELAPLCAPDAKAARRKFVGLPEAAPSKK